jgi:hypothetical protein
MGCVVCASCYTIEIDSLIEKGFLKKERRHHPAAVQNAIDVFICPEEGRRRRFFAD